MPPRPRRDRGRPDRLLKTRGEEYAYAFETEGVVRTAIDRVHAKPASPIAGAQEIAFFPPMTGG